MRKVAFMNGQDASTEVNIELPNPFFRTMTPKLKKLLNEQWSHIETNCLSDPPGVVLHRQNPTTGKTFCCRGRPSCENANLYLDLLTGKHLGVNRADRLTSCFFELLNHRTRITRLGELPNGKSGLSTIQTERIGMLNTLARSCGYGDDDLPFPDVSLPALVSDLDKFDIGFNKAIKLRTGQTVQEVLEENVQVPVATVDDFYDSANNNDLMMDETQQDVQGDDDADDLSLNSFLDDIQFEDDDIKKRVLELLPKIRSRESTMEAYVRLTNEQQWIPFHSANPNCPKTAVDYKEETLFDAMEMQYIRSRQPRQNKGYYSFCIAWNLEVAKRYKRKIVDGEENVLLIHRKNVEMLQNHYDKTKQRITSVNRVNLNNTHVEMDRMNDTLRTSRQGVTPLPPLQQAQPIVYDNKNGIAPFGNLFALNPEVIAQKVTPTTNCNPAPWMIEAPLLTAQPKHPLANFRRTTWCLTCGFRKNEHENEESFGSKCRRELCGKCYMRKELHNDGRMGPFCPFENHPVRSRQPYWNSNGRYVTFTN
jgi:hypothetical protein